MGAKSSVINLPHLEKIYFAENKKENLMSPFQFPSKSILDPSRSSQTRVPEKGKKPQAHFEDWLIHVGKNSTKKKGLFILLIKIKAEILLINAKATCSLFSL